MFGSVNVKLAVSNGVSLKHHSSCVKEFLPVFSQQSNCMAILVLFFVVCLITCTAFVFMSLTTQNIFRLYCSGSSGPVLLLLHGGGHSALSWAVFTVSLINTAAVIDCLKYLNTE